MVNRKWSVLIVLALLSIFGVVYWTWEPRSNQDLRMAFVSSDGIVLKSISLQRRMINVMRINSDVQVWIPGGLGWYESGKVKRLLEQEKQLGRVEEILFFNFGFDPSIVKFSAESGGWDWWQMGKNWGWKNYLAYLYMGGGGLMTKEEKVTGQLGSERDFLTSIMPRDFADSMVIEEGIKSSVYNAGNVNGLAATVARNLEWMGMVVYGVETINSDNNNDTCRLVFGGGVEGSKTGRYLREIFERCKYESDTLLGNGEIELYLTDKYAEVINYQSYNEVRN